MIYSISLRRCFRDVPEGMWICIQDEEFLEQCIGLPPPWRSIMRRAAVLAAMTSGRLPLGRRVLQVLHHHPLGQVRVGHHLLQREGQLGVH
jgi:hypothetical protein